MKLKELIKNKHANLLCTICIFLSSILIFSLPCLTKQGTVGSYIHAEENTKINIESFRLNGFGGGKIISNGITYKCKWYISISGSDFDKNSVLNIVWQNKQSQFDYLNTGVVRDQSSKIIYFKK